MEKDGLTNYLQFHFVPFWQELVGNSVHVVFQHSQRAMLICQRFQDIEEYSVDSRSELGRGHCVSYDTRVSPKAMLKKKIDQWQ